MEHPFTTFTNILRQQVIEPIEYAVQSFDPEQPNYNPPLQEALYSKKLVPVANRTTKREAMYIAEIPSSFCRNSSTLLSINELQFFENITHIGANAFSGCTNLSTIILPHGLRYMASEVFSYCTSLHSIILPDNIELIPTNCFDECVNLSNIKIGENTKDILGYAFYNCGMEEVTIPQNIQNIFPTAFNGCKQHDRIIVHPDNATYFNDENGLLYDRREDVLVICPKGKTSENLEIKVNISTIGPYSFYGVYNVKSITIPSSVNRIDSYSFSMGGHVQTFKCLSETPPSLGSNNPFGNASGTTLYVPSQSVDTYKNNSAWNVFKEILPIEE